MYANLIAPIPGSEGYFATRSGKILSTRFGKLKALKDSPHKKGYRTVVLYRQTEQKTYWVHKLVLMAFDRDRRNGEVCLHANNDPADNRLSNIRWGTPKENSQQMVRDGRCSSKPRFDGKAIRNAVGTQREIAERFGCSQSAVSMIKRGLRQ